MSRRGLKHLAIPSFLVASVAVMDAGPADACRVVQVELTLGELKPVAPSQDPVTRPQVVAWIEDPSGAFVATLFITQTTGRYGLGNRPGIMEFNSDFGWPYGRRETVFPIWAHRHGVSYPRIVFQDGRDRDLSHSFGKSSKEP